MPDIKTSAPGYVGVFLLLIGLFLVLAGLRMIEVRQIKVMSGKRTWIFGVLLISTGILFLLPDIVDSIGKTNIPKKTETPPGTMIFTNTPIYTILQEPTPTIIPPANEPIGWQNYASSIVPAYYPGQSFIADSGRIRSVAVGIGPYKGVKGGDVLTLGIYTENNIYLTELSKVIDEGFDGWAHFELPGGGLQITTGQTLILRLVGTDKGAFFWKYSDNFYLNGYALMGVPRPDIDFFFRVNH